MYDIWGVVMSYEIYVEGVMVYAGFRCVAGLRGRVWLSSAGFSRSFLWLETFLSRQPRCMIQNVSLQNPESGWNNASRSALVGFLQSLGLISTQFQ